MVRIIIWLAVLTVGGLVGVAGESAVAGGDRPGAALQQPAIRSELAEALISPPSSTEDISRKGAAVEDLNEYRIEPEDVLEISVWKSPELSITVTVRPDGVISMPLIGSIEAGGHTPSYLQDTILSRLKEYKQDPKVSVIVREANSHVFFIMGEIAKPGRYPLKSDTTLLQAIATAGGFSQWADKDRVLVIRKMASSGEEKRLTVRYKDILSGKNPNANIGLEAGDTVVVP